MRQGYGLAPSASNDDIMSVLGGSETALGDMPDGLGSISDQPSKPYSRIREMVMEHHSKSNKMGAIKGMLQGGLMGLLAGPIGRTISTLR